MGLTRQQLVELLAAGTFDQLVGEVENAWFDAKAVPYQLDDKGKRELARDVSALANAAGGVLVIGARTEASAQHRGDEVVEIRAFEEGLVNPAQYRHILDGWIYPPVHDLAVEWAALPDDSTRGLIIIRVPEQPLERRPFLVTKSLSGGRIAETFFGYAERRSDTNAPMGVGDIQRALRVGLQYERTLEARLDALEALVRDEQRDTRRASTAPDITERVSTAISGGDMSNERTFALAARGVPEQRLRTIFSTDLESIQRALEKPPVWRYSGWDLSTESRSEIVEGRFVRVRGNEKVIDLYRDGTLVMVCRADNAFLGWAMKDEKLNPLGVVELVYSFVSFYARVLDDFPEPPSRICFSLSGRNLHKDGNPTKLAPYAVGSVNQIFNDGVHSAPKDDVNIEAEVATDDVRNHQAAFELIREFYFWFGFDEAKIPYIRRDGPLRVFDLASVAGA